MKGLVRYNKFWNDKLLILNSLPRHLKPMRYFVVSRLTKQTSLRVVARNCLEVYLQNSMSLSGVCRCYTVGGMQNCFQDIMAAWTMPPICHHVGDKLFVVLELPPPSKLHIYKWWWTGVEMDWGYIGLYSENIILWGVETIGKGKCATIDEVIWQGVQMWGMERRKESMWESVGVCTHTCNFLFRWIYLGWRTCEGRYHHDKQGNTLEVRTSTCILASIPWEFLGHIIWS